MITLKVESDSRTKDVVCNRAADLTKNLWQPFLTQVARLKTALTNAENDMATSRRIRLPIQVLKRMLQNQPDADLGLKGTQGD
jgi:hypothetical protein